MMNGEVLKIGTRCKKFLECGLYSIKPNIFLSPYYLLGIILDTGGHNRSGGKKKEKPCLQNLHSNEDINDFGFICF